MKVAISDFEMSGFKADSSILLCCCIKEYGKKRVKTIRADKFKNWDKHRTNEKEFIQAVSDELDNYDILIFHNGVRFDKRYFNAKSLQYGIKPIFRYKKIIDPIQLAWRHLSLGRNSLAALIDYLQISAKKTPIELHRWLSAAYEGDKKCMDIIAKHCKYDVITLEKVYDKLRSLIDRVDNKGSAY